MNTTEIQNKYPTFFMTMVMMLDSFKAETKEQEKEVQDLALTLLETDVTTSVTGAFEESIRMVSEKIEAAKNDKNSLYNYSSK